MGRCGTSSGCPSTSASESSCRGDPREGTARETEGERGGGAERYAHIILSLSYRTLVQAGVFCFLSRNGLQPNLMAELVVVEPGRPIVDLWRPEAMMTRELMSGGMMTRELKVRRVLIVRAGESNLCQSSTHCFCQRAKPADSCTGCHPRARWPRHVRARGLNAREDQGARPQWQDGRRPEKR